MDRTYIRTYLLVLCGRLNSNITLGGQSMTKRIWRNGNLYANIEHF